MLQQEKALVESEVSAFKTICIKLIKLYNRQDEIASKLWVVNRVKINAKTLIEKLTLGVTNPDEAKLYKELAKVETKKIKISEAFQKWREARSQVIDACREFSTALKKWKEIKNDSYDNNFIDLKSIKGLVSNNSFSLQQPFKIV
jgi:hypothetical protein